MNSNTLGAAVIAAKTLSDTAAGRAESAATRAEIAAEEAGSRNYSVRVQDHGLIFESEVSS